MYNKNKFKELQYYKNQYYGGGVAQEKIQKSDYFCTINTNKVSTPEFKQKFIDVLYEFFNEFDDFVDFRKGWKPDNHMDIEIVPDHEIGPKKQRLHAHFIVKIRHKSNIVLNYDKVRDYFKEHLTGGDNIHFNAIVIPNSNDGLTDEERMINYIHKSRR